MNITQFNGNVLHVENSSNSFPKEIDYGHELYVYGTHFNCQKTVAVYYKKSWLGG